MTDKSRTRSAALIVRTAQTDDAAGIAALSDRVYTPVPGHTQRMIRSQINNFAEGQFVAELNGEIVGHCATFIISGDVALKPHRWSDITGDGLASRHDPSGDYLYGMEVCVDPAHRRLRIGQRLYAARKALCERLDLYRVAWNMRET